MAFQCLICFDDAVGDGEIATLSCDHRFCKDCLRQHVGSRPQPTCPAEGCGCQLAEADVEAICGEGSPLLEEWQQAALSRAVDRLGDVIACPNPGCSNAMSCDRSSRQRWECDCGWPAWCTQCKQPYHYKVDCGHVQALRSLWLQWVREGRAAYHRESAQHQQRAAQIQGLQEAMARHAECDRDEHWKEVNCRACPTCGRVVQKMEGCDEMRCGVDYHGGNRQNGCGTRFRWAAARAYQMLPAARRLPALDVEQVRLRGAGLVHPFCRCAGCSGEIVGPRFRCIHCPDFSLCAECDRSACAHPADHVFEVLFKAEYDLSAYLPIGAAVQLADDSRESGFQARVVEEICPDVYRVELADGLGTRVLHRSALRVTVRSPEDAERHVVAHVEAQEAAARHLLREKDEGVRLMRDGECTGCSIS